MSSGSSWGREAEAAACPAAEQAPNHIFLFLFPGVAATPNSLGPPFNGKALPGAQATALALWAWSSSSRLQDPAVPVSPVSH